MLYKTDQSETELFRDKCQPIVRVQTLRLDEKSADIIYNT
jgi:hypothetical protein